MKRSTIFAVNKVLKARGILFNFHSLRHTHATLAIEAGIPIKSIAARLGDSVEMVNKIYANDILNKLSKYLITLGASI
ncbi:tyrosine-type recombinase/integrase [Pectinatus cerevisiiphilus]|uniref:tyrosine-type recombinase/integrase n=1 Tax=Pectinatus cerevisiiphilus TaxID=86956 RepID=UPI0010441D2C